MILDKIYSENINAKDLSLLINMFFKIKNKNVHKISIDNFVLYLRKLNEHLSLTEFHKFKTIRNILVEDLIPTIEQYLEVMKIYNDKKELISYTYNKDKYSAIT